MLKKLLLGGLFLIVMNGFAAPGDFISTWQTNGSNQVTIPTIGGGYNYDVDWGDGNVTTGETGNATHTYASPGVYTVSITAIDFPRIYTSPDCGDDIPNPYLLTVEQW